MAYKYLVEGVDENGEQRRRSFYYSANAEEFAESCGWSDVRYTVEPYGEYDLAARSAIFNLTARGYTIEDDEIDRETGAGFVVAFDGDVLVFIDVRIGSLENGDDLCDEWAEPVERERRAMGWLAGAELESDFQVRFDNLAMVVIGEDRALVKHYVNVLGEM